jgi:hypothetical protein
MNSVRSRVAQSVLCLNTNWTTRVLSPREEDFSHNLSVQASSYSLGTEGYFHWVKEQPGCDADR